MPGLLAGIVMLMVMKCVAKMLKKGAAHSFMLAFSPLSCFPLLLALLYSLLSH